MLSVSLYWVYEHDIFPTRDASPPLEFAFRASTKRSKTKNRYLYPFYHTTTTYTPSILHLTQTRYNSLTINTLLSVRYYQRHLHASYTHHKLPHSTSTGGRHYGIGGTEKSVAPTDFPASQWRITCHIRPNRLLGSGVGSVRCVQGSVRYFGIILHS